MKTKKKTGRMIILTIFLGVTLFFTFFSKTIYNHNLPIVKAVFPGEGNIENEVKGRAEIAYKDTCSVYAEKDGRLKKVCVSEGEWVKKGQVLMEIKPETEEKSWKVTAPKAGVILSLGIEEGMYVSAMQNTVLIEIGIVNNQWTLNLKVNVEQAGFIRKGSMADIRIKDMEERLQGVVERLNPYKDESGSEGYTVIIHAECDRTEIAGSRAEVMIQNNSKDYESILPAKALRKDSKGYYIYTLQRQESVLGKYYVVTRTSVDLLDSNKKYVAILGADNDLPVVVSETKKLQDGSRVRYQERSIR